MIRDLYDDYAVIQTGYWRLEVDTARPRITSMKNDLKGLGHYGQEILEPGYGGESICETAQGCFRSRHSMKHEVERYEYEKLYIKGINLGDFAHYDWCLGLTGKHGNILRIEVSCEIKKTTEALINIPFGFQCYREFALWSKPSLRIGHNPADGFKTSYSSREEVRKRRVIGYHDAEEMDGFFIHASPTYPDLRISLENGFYHIEQNYSAHVLFGISSHFFNGKPVTLNKGKYSWTLELEAFPQGSNAPVRFFSENPALNEFVPGFFDGYLLSAVACDHEIFGNNPYRHAYSPMAIELIMKGYMVTDRISWSKQQGNMEERWGRQILRTLKEGRISEERLVVLMDSGVWQDACGHISHEVSAYSGNALFVYCCTYYILKTGDMEFARNIYSDLKSLLLPLYRLDTDGDGLLENPLPGTPGSPASSYNDNLSIGHKDAYLNIASYCAFKRMADLSGSLKIKSDTVFFDEKVESIKKAFNEQLWDENTGRYVGWIDVNGNSHDAWYTYVNFPAISCGIATGAKAERIMESFLSHPNHHLIFAGGMNLEPINDGTFKGDAEFGLWLNGGVLLGPASHELYARAEAKGSECAWVMLRDIMEQWRKDRLSGTPLLDWCRTKTVFSNPRLEYTGKNAYTWIDATGASGAGTEPYLSDGGAILWSIYTGIIGIRPDFKGLAFNPHIPGELGCVEIDIRLMGKTFTIKTRGYGDCLKSLYIDGRIIKGKRITWDEMREGSIINMEVSKD